MFCGKEERCWLYFPSKARGDLVSSGEFHLQRCNFKIALEETLPTEILCTSYTPSFGFLICIHKSSSFVAAGRFLIFPTTVTVLRTGKQKMFLKKILLKRESVITGPERSTLTNSTAVMPNLSHHGFSSAFDSQVLR